ncbi:hypothetical protein HDU76_009034 [Blyttiomyces sp. JEL0837]|nr:hypothetical protein HDU76_009034 [Blyttiomyces sp. JEL0837]
MTSPISRGTTSLNNTSSSSATRQHNDACIFCKIVQRKAPAHIIYEDEKIMAFLDIAPMNKGHSLIIPKYHHINLIDTPSDILSHIAVRLPWLAKGICKAVGTDSFNLLQNNGAVAGQVVFHLHFHIMPRFNDDGIFPNKSPGQDRSWQKSVETNAGGTQSGKKGASSSAPEPIIRKPTLTTEIAVPLVKAIAKELQGGFKL